MIQTQFFWIHDSKTYHPSKFQKIKGWYERDIIFLRQPINSISRQVLWKNRSNLFKCRLFTLERTVFIFFFFRRIQMDWRDMGIRVSYQIKRKREKKRRRWPKRRRKTPPFSLIPEIMFSYVLFIIFSIEMQG